MLLYVTSKLPRHTVLQLHSQAGLDAHAFYALAIGKLAGKNCSNSLP